MADLDTSEDMFSLFMLTDLGSPEGLAIDHLSRNMYWTDSGLDRIEVSTLDGKHRRMLFDTDLLNPRAIIADPVNGYALSSHACKV